MNKNLMTRNDADGIASKAVLRLAELAKKPQQREADLGAVDLEARTVELSFSSEVEYKRWFGMEILGHDAGEVRLGRLQNGAAALWNHDWDDMRGVVEPGTVRLDSDRKGRAVIRFSKSPAGEQLMQDVNDKIVTKVSVGYMVHGLKLVEERDEVDVYRVNDWEPFEISFVSVPADDTVGVGRGLEKPPEEQQQKQVQNSTIIKDEPAAMRNQTKENQTMYRYFTDAQGNQCRIATDEAGKDVGTAEIVLSASDAARNAGQRGTDAERTRTAAIMAMGDQYASSIANARELAAAHIKEGKTPEDLQRALLEEFNKRTAKPLSEQSRATELGMSEREVQNYSFMRAIRALANPNDKAVQRAAAFEIECSLTAQSTLGRSAQGILVPPDVLSRAMSTTQGNAGSYMVENEIAKGSFIDLLRNRTTIMRMATVIAGLRGNVDIPKKLSDGQAYWLGEGQNATETGFTLGQISMSPKTLGAYTDMTRRLLIQDSMGVESMVRNDLINAMSQEIDKKGFYGTGTEYQPRGLKNYSGINAVDFATAQKPTFNELVDMETEVAADNAEATVYMMHTRVRGHCKKTARFGTGTESTIWEPGNTVNGYRTEITNQLVANDVFFGDFSQFVIGLWSGLDLTVDTAALALSGGLRVIAFQDLDMALRRQEAICWGSDAAA